MSATTCPPNLLRRNAIVASRRASAAAASSPARARFSAAVPALRAIAAVVVAARCIGLPRIAGLDETWGCLSEGDPWWLGVAVLLEAASYGGHVLLFRGVFVQPGSPIGWRECSPAGHSRSRMRDTPATKP
jgi:hypothetical protein